MTQPKQSKLSEYTNPKGPQAPTKIGRLMASLTSGERWYLHDVPGTEPPLQARWRTPSAREQLEVEALITEHPIASRVPAHLYGHVETIRAALTLSRVVWTVPTPGQTDAEPIGTADDWLALGVDTIDMAWSRIADLQALEDPRPVDVTPAEAAEIRDAIEKKEPALLRRVGSRALASWLTSSAGLHASYRANKSEPGATSPAPSPSPTSPPPSSE